MASLSINMLTNFIQYYLSWAPCRHLFTKVCGEKPESPGAEKWGLHYNCLSVPGQSPGSGTGKGQSSTQEFHPENQWSSYYFLYMCIMIFILIFLVLNYLDIGGGSIFKDCIVLKAKGCNLLDSIRFTELRLCFIIKCEYLSKTWKYLCKFWWSVGQSCNQVEYSDCPARGGTATVNGAERERVDSPTKGG